MSSSSKSYYLTLAIPYVNAKPHLGHMYEWFQGDAIARYQRLLGKEVAFTCGTDENSLKNVQAAEKAGLEPQAWLDQYAVIFEDAFRTFGISLTHFRRGSDQQKHWPGVQALWRRCLAAGDIYKKTYEGLYCIGCESFYTEAELIDGKCPEHLTVPEKIKEENYFFRLSKYQAQIEELIRSDKLAIYSDQFKNEMLGFVGQGLEDFSVSRSTARSRGVGVPVPDDESQVMYVWFDALNVYMTAIGWGFDEASWKKLWPADVHVIGKGINRFHSVYWIGMLLSAGLPTPKAISVHGYITADGQKMSKSLGNVIDPFDITSKYGLEPIRYYLLKEIPSHNDGDFSEHRFREIFTADLTNGLGNLCSRVAKLCANTSWKATKPLALPEGADQTYAAAFASFEIDQALQWVAEQVRLTDQYLNQQKPWKLEAIAAQPVLTEAVSRILQIGWHLQPFMPDTAAKILDAFHRTEIPAIEPLFPRLETAKTA